MKLWSGIITEKLTESRDFYIRVLEATVIFESDWFALLNVQGQQLAFMLPNMENQAPMFKQPLNGPGIWLGVDVDDVDAHYQRIQSLNVPIALDIKDEAWGDRHFAILDPNGIGIDFVKHTIS